MSRRRLHWRKHIIQAQGNIEKIMPTHTIGKGEYLVKADIPDRLYSPQEGESKKVCCLPMNTEKEARVRAIAKRLGY